MNRKGTSGGARALACASLLLLCAAAGAQEVDLALSIGAFHSDNIGRTSVDERSETVGEAGLQFGIARDQGRLTADVSADLRYRKYFDNAYDEELMGGLSGLLTYRFLPDRFSWVVQDNFGKALIDPRAVESPDNRQSTNYFSTGPDFRLPVGDRTEILLSGRWSDASFSESNADSQRLTGNVGLVRHLGTDSSLSLNAMAERVEFDDEIFNSNYDRQSAFIGYDTRGARTVVSLRAGYTAMHDFGDTTDGPLFDLTVARELSARSTLTLNAGTNLTDSVNAMRRDQDISGVSVEGDIGIVSGDPFQSDYVSIGLALAGVRTSLDLVADWRAEDHERDAVLNRDSIGAAATLTRRLSPTLSMSIYGRWTSEDFSDSDVEFDEWLFGADLDWEFARRFGLTFRVDRYEGSGDTPFGTDQRDYTENRYALDLTYTPRR
ncbi:MAG TPA: hypothetical protein PKL49_05765 [Steroidobacteraceae bacterium]|nr:hypothetical protein [Steroidobacteraceae bacterium]